MTASLIDAHCHVSDVWYEPAETLMRQMDANGVERAVLTQLLGQYENSYQGECVRRWPDRFVSVGALDPAAGDSIGALEKLADGGHAGVRLRPVPAPNQTAAVADVWSYARRLGLVISCIATMEQLADPAFAQLAAQTGSAPILLEHGAGLGRADQTESEEVFERLLKLAANRSLLIKLPCLGQVETRAPFVSGLQRPLRPGPAFARVAKLVEAFGAERVLWGSDFPVVSTREGYANGLAWTQDALGDLPEADRSAIFGSTAARIFG
jgi:L-fuconolactonase